MNCRFLSHRIGTLATGLWTALLLVLTPAAPSLAQDKPREQQIADVEKQIAELEKKLDELRKPTTTPEPDGTLPEPYVKQFNWRCIGPASMGGRITGFAVYEKDPCIFWIATASGGLLKTTNNGVTFEHQFDHEATVSIGAIAVAPSDPKIVWVGTGENNPRNSVSYGDGVYKSTDGGKTWKNMGLKKSFQIGKIAIHPKDPNVVYVGALGRLYGTNEERGLFKTTDGGQNWQKILYVDDKTGVIDVQMHPTEPDTLLIATWERERDAFDSIRGEEPPEGYDAYDPSRKWGPGSGLWKTTDGGKTFKRLTKGLPSSPFGRVGIDYYRKNPNTVYAIVDCATIGMGTAAPQPAYLGLQGEEADDGMKVTQVVPNSPAAGAGVKIGDVLQTFEGKPVKETEELTDLLRGKKGGDKVALRIVRDNKPQEVTATLAQRGPGFGGGFGGGGQFAGAALVGFMGRDVQGSGITVVRLFPDSTAQKAGLMEGDVVHAIGGKEVKTFNALMEEVNRYKPGDRVILTVKRADLSADIPLTLEQRTGQVLGTASAKRPNGGTYGGQNENIQNWQGPNGHEYGGLYRSMDGGESWTRINSLNPRPMYFSLLRVDPNDEKYVYVGGVSLHRSKNGGKTFTPDGGNGVHPDNHAMWIDPRDGRHVLVGCDGGVYVTYDRMDHWDFLNDFAIGQFYHVALDNKKPYNVYGGLQDNGSWGGPSRVLRAPGIINEDWQFIAGGDGFVCRVDPIDPEYVYFESQDGNMGRYDIRLGRQAGIRPGGTPEGRVPRYATLLSFYLANWDQPLARGNQAIPFLLSGRPGAESGYRYNWNTPFLLSAHNPKVVYAAGNHVFRSMNKGADMKSISPDITRTNRGTGTALAESPRNPDVLWVGTDDGALCVTRDGGKTWTNVAERVGLPSPRWVSTIEASRYVEGRAYVCFDAHRSNDDEPYVYVTEDFGKTWKSIRANLPTGSSRCCREDVKNPDLLFVGTEFSLYAAVDRGGHWTRINNNLPTVAVHEVAVHPTAGEIVAATHGRSLWIMDVTALRQMTPTALKAKATLYQPNSVTRWRTLPGRTSVYGVGSRRFVGQNPPNDAQIFYSLTKKAEKVSLKVMDVAGKTVRELTARADPGLHLIHWDLMAAGGGGGPGGLGGGRQAAGGGEGRQGSGQGRQGGGGGQGRQGGGGGGGGFRGGFAGGRAVPNGAYRVVLTVDGEEFTQTFEVLADPIVAEEPVTDGPQEPPFKLDDEEEKDSDKDKGQ